MGAPIKCPCLAALVDVALNRFGRFRTLDGAGFPDLERFQVPGSMRGLWEHGFVPWPRAHEPAFDGQGTGV